MNASTIRKLSLATTFLALFPLSTGAWAQARLPAQMYYAELYSPATRPIEAGRLNVIQATTVLRDQELTQLAIWLSSDLRAIARAATVTEELRRRGLLRAGEQIVGLSGGQALKVRAGEVAALRAVTCTEIVAGE